MKCQVIYNIQECVENGSDIHSLFSELVGEPSPSGAIDFAPDTLKELEPEIFSYLNQSIFVVMEESEAGKWEILSKNLLPEDATRIVFEGNRIGKHRLMVSPEAAFIMQRQFVEDCSFESGYVVLPPGRTPNTVISAFSGSFVS